MNRLSRYAAFLALFSLAVSVPVYAHPADRAADLKTAFTRAHHLQRGINASEWFAQSATDYSAARTDRYTDSADIALIAKLGFDNVRLSIDATPLEQWPHGKDGLNTEFVGRLDKVVDTMLAAGLAVQICIRRTATSCASRPAMKVWTGW